MMRKLVMKNWGLHHSNASVHSMSNNKSNQTLVNAGSFSHDKTPRAGTKRNAIFVEKERHNTIIQALSPSLPPPPEHEPLQQQDVARAKTPIRLPYIPDLAWSQDYTATITNEDHADASTRCTSGIAAFQE